jgi:hypothetical protein
MAHFAQIDENNIVVRVLVVSDEYEDDGQNYLANVLSLGGTWIQTSYNETIRYNFAGIGMTYDEVNDAFIPLKPDGDFILNPETFKWELNEA